MDYDSKPRDRASWREPCHFITPATNSNLLPTQFSEAIPLSLTYNGTVTHNLRENLHSALRAIRDNLLRSSLTMVGIIIGVGSVVLLLAIGTGVKLDVTKQIDSLGSNVVFIVPGKLDASGQPNAMSTLGISTLTEADCATLLGTPGVKQVIPLMFVFGAVERNKETFSAFVFASTPGIFDVRPYPLEEGRLFNKSELDQPVCVLSHAPKEQMFGTKSALGKSVLVQGKAFKIVGVLEKEEQSLFGQFSFVNTIYIPLPAAKKMISGGQLNRILLQTDYTKDPKITLAVIKQKMLKNHGGTEDFGLVTPAQLLGAIYKLFDIVQALVLGIGAISLVVAGVGIMNIMLVTVTERTREIGIRKTVGARSSDIFVQFLTEALTLSFAGGAVGTVLAMIICKITAMYSPLKPVVNLPSVGLAFLVCLSVGLIFGVTPAMRAAKQDPINALRHE